MKHTRPDYDRIQDPANLIPQDEPVFLLRGQDHFAPDAVLLWARRVEQAGGDPKIVELARQQAMAMSRWQNQHPIGEEHVGKMPDLPKEDEGWPFVVGPGGSSGDYVRKQTSPELSTKAARYMSMDNDELRKLAIRPEHQTVYDHGQLGEVYQTIEPQLTSEFCDMFRSFCASLVSQDEIKGQQ